MSPAHVDKTTACTARTTGHFALETHAEEIGALIVEFLSRVNGRGTVAA